MSTSVTGQVVDEAGNGISGLLVVVRCESVMFPSDLGNATTDGAGDFAVAIAEDTLTDAPGSRQLGVYVYTGRGRRQLHVASFDDTGEGSLSAGQITVRRADTEGWAVTLPGTDNALPIRGGNALRLLIDDQVAWRHVAEAMVHAQKSISVMELCVDMPRAYDPDPTQENPEVVLSFADPFDPAHPRPVLGPTDYRPERIWLDAATHGKQVRVMISAHDLATLVRAIPAGVILLIPVLVGALFLKPFFAVWSALFNLIFGSGPSGSAGAVADYLQTSGSNAKVLGFEARGYSVVHAKAVLVDAAADTIDNAEAIVLGSPFEQSYWDTTAHPVYEPRRGSCTGEPIPVHDVSLGVRGPAVADLQRQFGVHWNRDCEPADRVAALDPPPAELSQPGDGQYLASVQLVRTVNESTLPGLDEGEMGVLEAYQRAIANATDYIYIENQYITNETIAQALVDALTDASRPHLQVILMVNVVPDLPFYPSWQTNLFERIRRDAGADGASRFGVFTAWSHSPPAPEHEHTKPIIMPNYLHTKTAIVDGRWATIGSANLDGASLDYFQILRPLQFGTFRNDELNYLIFNDIEGCPATDAIDQLRLALWSEHLGIDPSDSRLSTDTLSAGNGWLKLWTDTATAKLQGLIADPTVIDPAKGRVLAYPPGATSGFGLLWNWSDPHKNFLEESKIGGRSIDLDKIDLVQSTTAFSFHDGTWADQ